jgi:hypothetical protein
LKREIPMALVLISSLVTVIAYYFNIGPISALSNNIQNWGVILSSFTLGLAAVNLVRVHAIKIQRASKGWVYSVLLLISLLVTIFLGLTQGINSLAYRYFFVTPRSALGATIYSLLGFYIASASYRAFIARNVDATILLLSATLVLFGQTPYGAMAWKHLPSVVQWFLAVPNMSAQRGIIIGGAIGAVALSLRIMTGLEKAYSGMGNE